MAGASSETTTSEKIRPMVPREYPKVPTPVIHGSAEPAQEFDGGPRPAVRAISDPTPAGDSSGILNAIEAVYRVASARRAWLLSELKALDAALAPFAGAPAAKPGVPGPSDDGALVRALLQFAEQNKGDSP